MQFGFKIKSLQLDGGGEFISNAFKDLIASNGMTHRVSCPYTPQQNGLVERKHCHIIETTITLMDAAGLAQEFWYHASAHVVFLINRMPSKTLRMYSPYFALFDKHPNLQELKIFGIAVYPYLRHYNDNKLQPRF